MPWCPKCRNEYKEGYEVCADCGTPLVASLEEIDKAEIITESDNSEASFEAENLDLQEEYGNIELSEELKLKVLEQAKKREEYKPYVKAKDRAENYRSSAFAMLLVGVLGMVFLVLCVFGVINLAITGSGRILAFVTMLIMFVAFILIGVRSYVASKTIGALADDEDNFTASVESYFRENCTAKVVDERAVAANDEDMTDEIKYFKRTEVIKDIIKEQFGELDESYVESETEVIYGILFE